MTDIASAKRAVLDHMAALDASDAGGLEEALRRYTAPGAVFHFTHPFPETTDAAGAASGFWQPLRAAFAPLQRRQDIFFASPNDLDGGATTWVVSMGHLLGLFDQPFLGMRPTRQATMLRYCAFFQVGADGINDVTLFFDVMNLMGLVGAEAWPPSLGANMVTPGPRTHDGLLFKPQPEDEGQATLNLYQTMINRLLDAKVDTRLTPLEADWHEDMIWWGPGGIGAPYTQERYVAQHAAPFADGLEWGTFFGHRCELAEGRYGGFFGWPTFDVRSRGGYIGVSPASERFASMRVVDLYRREGAKLAENWNFIDHLHFLDQLGVDLIARQKALTGL